MARINRKPDKPFYPFYDRQPKRRPNPYLDRVMAEYPGRLIHPSEAVERRGSWREWASGRPLHIEIGPGKGRHITEYSIAHQDAIALGIEIKFRWLYKVAKRLELNGVKNGYVLRFDANFLSWLFAPEELSGAMIFFPDPWWLKARHRFRRLITPDFLDDIYRILEPGGILEIKTDNKGRFSEHLSDISASSFMLTDHTEDLASSRYNEGNIETIFETKFREKGIPICYLRALKD